MTAIRSVAFVVVVSALAMASPASAKSKRATSETGPLIMSSGYGAQASIRRLRAADICKPATIRVR